MTADLDPVLADEAEVALVLGKLFPEVAHDPGRLHGPLDLFLFEKGGQGLSVAAFRRIPRIVQGILFPEVPFVSAGIAMGQPVLGRPLAGLTSAAPVFLGLLGLRIDREGPVETAAESTEALPRPHG